MAADPLVYCLEQLTDYDQFERLCHDLMALDGYRGIEPLGGTKDKGRDAIHVDRTSNNEVTIFAYSVREDWRNKLDQDSEKIRNHGHTCQRLAFLCTSHFTAGERDKAVNHIRTTYGWTLELYGLERLRTMLATTHRQLVAQHPQIFCPPFFPVAGGLSLAFSPDHLVIDHVDADAALAHWLARRLTLAGYRVWCRGLAPLAGSSVTETIRGLLNNRAFRYICILSPEALTDPDFTARRNMAQAVGQQRGPGFVLPALATPIDTNALDQETRGLVAARFTRGWADGLKDVEEVLATTNCPRKPEGARELAIRSYFPPDIVLSEPETLASNLFRVIRLPQAILRFHSQHSIDHEGSPYLAQWGYRKIGPNHFLSFHHPPIELATDLGIISKGGAVWNSVTEIDGVRVNDLIKELIKRSLYAECRRRSLHYCQDRNLVYFPFDLLAHDHLSFRKLSGQATFFKVAGERTHGKGGRARKYRYNLAPVFAPKEAYQGGYEIIVRIRLRLTDIEGNLFSGRTANSYRKKICKSWWNEEWLARTMGVMQFLANGNEHIAIGDSDEESIVIDPQPRTWNIPVRLNEDALAEAIAIRQEEEPHLRAEEDHDDD
jgi:hypothetical protein